MVAATSCDESQIILENMYIHRAWVKEYRDDNDDMYLTYNIAVLSMWSDP